MTKLRLITILPVIGFFLWFLTTSVLAATGTLKQINFQGKVATKTTGVNVADGSYTFVFSLYSASSGGVAIWTETKSVTVTNGIFQTLLGDTTTLPGSVDFNTDNIYLGITFNADGEMAPRIRMAAVPYAFNALKVAGLTVTDTTGTLTIPTGKTVSFADAFTTSGANPLTLTTTGSTNVTLPTTGTLATLAGAESLTNKTIGAGGLTFSNSETVANATDGTFTLGRNDAGTVTLNAADDNAVAAFTITSGGAATLTLDAGGAATVNIGTTNANAVSIGNASASTGITFDKGSSGNFVFRSNGSALSCAGNTNGGALSLNASGQLICTDDDGGAAATWDTIGDATAGGAIAMAEYAQTLDWNTAATAAAFDGLKITITNDAGTDATTQRGLVIENSNDGGATGTTESLLAIDNADANEAVTQGLLITSSGAGGLTFGINLNDTDIVTDISFQNGESLDNNVDGTIAFNLPATGLANILTGNLKVGNGTPSLTQNAEDAYVEGTFEVDGIATFGSNVGIGTDTPTATLHIVTTQTQPAGFKYEGNVADLTYNMTNTSAGGRAYQIISAGTGSGVAGALRFYDNTAALDRMVISSAGNVGIGSTAPTTKLDVNGEIKGTSFSGSGLSDCDASGSKLLWDATAKTFSCGTDRASAYAVNAADDTKNASTVLADVTDMGFAVGTSETWVYQMYLIGNSGTIPDFDFAVTAPASSTCSASASDPENNTGAVSEVCGDRLAAIAGAGSLEQYIVTGYVATAGTSGTVQLQFSQNVSNASNSIIENNSYLIAFKVSGADLAEVYYSKETGLEPGTVVSLDPTISAGVKKSQGAYDPQVMGIVSTKPGLVIGDTGEGRGSPVFVALSGRVPVQVTDENGPIKPGDFLTPSSTPGKAMRATKAGSIIGQAMVGHETAGDGLIMAFVNTSYSQGSSVVNLLGGDAVPTTELLGKEVLNYLATQKEASQGQGYTSEILTDRVTAGLEIITPQLTAEKLLVTKGLTLENGDTSVFSIDENGNVTIAGMLTAKSITAETIQMTTLLQNSVATISAQLTALESTHSAGLVAGVSIDREGKTLFSRLAYFIDTVIFRKKVKFETTPEFNTDAGGFAKITKDSQEVAVTFKEAFENIPVISATPFASLNFAIANVTKTGFTIKIATPATQDTLFSWTAISIKDAKTFESEDVVPTSPTPLPTPTPTTTDLGEDSPAPPATPEVESTPEPTTEPTPEPEIVTDAQATNQQNPEGQP